MAFTFPQKSQHLEILVVTCNKQAVGLVLLVLQTDKHGLIILFSIKLETDLVPDFYMLALKDELYDFNFFVYHSNMKRVNPYHFVDDIKIVLKVGDLHKATAEKAYLLLLLELG